MIRLNHVTCQRGEKTVLHDLTLHVRVGELLQVAGPNGVGKTTLLHILLGLRQPDQGEVLISSQCSLAYLGHKIAVKPQLTVYENLSLNCYQQAPNQKNIDEVIDQIGLGAERDQLCRQLSRGQCQRVALARLLLSQACVWVLDEPFSGLDVWAKSYMEQKLKQQVEQGGSVVLTTHQPISIDKLAMKSLLLTAPF